MNQSIRFFENQFQQQTSAGSYVLNPFESMVLPHLQGSMLDYGCGMGNLALAVAGRGQAVTALDASETAIAALAHLADEKHLPIQAHQADLRGHRLEGAYESVACIGLLMFFDCDTANAQLDQLQAATRSGGVLALNVLVEGTTFLDMFEPGAYCLRPVPEWLMRFEGWELIEQRMDDFGAQGGRIKRFLTVVARKH
jgi:tellurite methyltransferase